MTALPLNETLFMKHQLGTAHVAHARLSPARHAFSYHVSTFILDLDHLAELDQAKWSFGYNRFGLYSLWDHDYLEKGPAPIRQKLDALLMKAGLDASLIARVQLITSPRVWGYVFNPVSFYFCYDDSNVLQFAVAEVNNTFRQKHVYVQDLREMNAENGRYRCRADKMFYVSPFFDVDGEYEFEFPASLDHDWTIRVDRWVNGSLEFTSSLRPLDVQTVTSVRLWRHWLSHPLRSWASMPLITWQAARLYYQRKLPIISLPRPTSTMTIRTAPASMLESFSQRVFYKFLRSIKHGALQITAPDGARQRFGDPDATPVDVTIHNWKFYSHVVRYANVGLGEAYTRGDFETSDLAGFLELFLINDHLLNDRSVVATWIGRQFNKLGHWARHNNLLNSRKNIKEHYDLSNDLFQAFLDRTMSYSCAVFEHANDTLESAQKNKIQRMISKARVGADDHVLEIGCGWGALAIELVRQTGCKVTGITLSDQQLELARQRVAQEGMEDRIELKLCDYRSLVGEFDRIISVEMLEAVGHDYFDTFFQNCQRLLKPNGLAVFQTITIADQHYDAYRRGCDWIQKHIFPGGHLPSLTELSNSLTRSTTFVTQHVENIGVHYAETLRRWCATFETQKSKILELGFDEAFFRKWVYYFRYCEAGFNQRRLGTLQLVISPAGSQTLPGLGEFFQPAPTHISREVISGS